MIYVFDLDGTIIDSTKRHYMLMERILMDYGIEVPSDFAKSYMGYKADGNSGKSYLKDILGLTPETADKIQKEWIDHIEDDDFLLTDELYPDALKALEEADGRIVFLTVRENESGLRKELTRLGIGDHELIVLPHTGSKSRVLKELNGDCIMIGDTEVDYEASKEACCKSYILNRGFRSERYWEQRGIRSHKDLSDLNQATEYS